MAIRLAFEAPDEAAMQIRRIRLREQLVKRLAARKISIHDAWLLGPAVSNPAATTRMGRRRLKTAELHRIREPVPQQRISRRRRRSEK
jgi:hypothetical protein